MTARPRRFALALACLACALALPVWSAEMLVEGEVVQVVPLGGSAPAGSSHCGTARPAAAAGLIELLRWDLRVACPEASGGEVASGYRVYYRWDGRTYSRVMTEPPGETVTLRVRLQ